LLTTQTANVLGLFYMRLWEVPIVITMGCVFGALGAVFVALNTHVVYALRHYFIPNSSRIRQCLIYLLPCQCQHYACHL
jgi:H+/Cl- antiporter ClcA